MVEGRDVHQRAGSVGTKVLRVGLAMVVASLALALMQVPASANYEQNIDVRFYGFPDEGQTTVQLSGLPDLHLLLGKIVAPDRYHTLTVLRSHCGKTHGNGPQVIQKGKKHQAMRGAPIGKEVRLGKIEIENDSAGCLVGRSTVIMQVAETNGTFMAAPIVEQVIGVRDFRPGCYVYENSRFSCDSETITDGNGFVSGVTDESWQWGVVDKNAF
jgi:hypothetical protein